MQNYEAITVREASLAHAKDLHPSQGFKHVSTVLSEAQDIFEYLTQDSAVDEEPKSGVKGDPEKQKWDDYAADAVLDPLAVGGYYQDGWNDAIDAVLGLQKKHGLQFEDTVTVGAVEEAIEGLRK